MRYLSRIYFVLVLGLLIVGCSDDDNPTKNEDDSPKAIEQTIAWDVKYTDNNHSIAIPLKVNPTFNGEALANGDKIGVFYDKNGSMICGGFSVWTGEGSIAVSAWGDDGQTTEKDGFNVSEQFVWLVQKASDQKNYTAEVEYESGPSSYLVNGITVVKSLSVN